MLHPYFDVIVPEEELIAEPDRFPLTLIFLVALILMVLAFVIIRRIVKKNRVQEPSQEPPAPVESHETE